MDRRQRPCLSLAALPFPAAREQPQSSKSILTAASTLKSLHDYKAAIHALGKMGIALQGIAHDPILYSYLLDPTYSSHRLADVALRRFNLKLSGDLAEAADITGRLTTALRDDVERAGLTKL